MSNKLEAIILENGPSPFAKTTVRTLDSVSIFFGKLAAFLVLPMTYALVHEVISRYFFNTPTIWAGDIALILYGIYFMIGSPFCLQDGMHIRADFLYAKWSVKGKAKADLFIYLFMYMPTHAMFLFVGWKYFYRSFLQNESIVSSPWMPIIWPMKLAIPVSLFLMLLQGISEIIKSYYAWRHGQNYWAKKEAHPGEGPANLSEDTINKD